MQFATRILKPVLAVVLLLLVIELAMLWLRPSPAAFARPREILTALPRFVAPGGLLPDVISTAIRTLVAFLLALPIGLAVGLTVAKVRWIKVEGTFLLDFLRSIPATALVPLFLVIFGLGSESKIAAGAFSGLLAIAIAVLVGFNSLNSERARVADRIGLRGARRILLYEIPELASSLFVGMRTAASLCLILVIVAEMFIGSDKGLGKIIMDGRYSDDVPGLYAAIVVAGFLGYLLNRAFVVIESSAAVRLGHIIPRAR